MPGKDRQMFHGGKMFLSERETKWRRLSWCPTDAREAPSRRPTGVHGNVAPAEAPGREAHESAAPAHGAGKRAAATAEASKPAPAARVWQRVAITSGPENWRGLRPHQQRVQISFDNQTHVC